MTHILAVYAYPDDIELLAAGTRALLVEKWHRVTVATLTAGECNANGTHPLLQRSGTRALFDARKSFAASVSLG